MMRGGVQGIQRRWPDRSRRSCHWTRAMSAGDAARRTTECFKERKAVLNTIDESSILRTGNYPRGSMEAFGKLDKGLLVQLKGQNLDQPLEPRNSTTPQLLETRNSCTSTPRDSCTRPSYQLCSLEQRTGNNPHLHPQENKQMICAMFVEWNRTE